MSIRKPRLLVVGHGGHGKDTVCEILRDSYGYSFVSSSWAALERAVWPAMRWNPPPNRLTYPDMQACYDDRHKQRALWHQIISEYNTPDKTRLARDIYADHEVYCGMRCGEEMKASRRAGLFDLTVWVDASKRVQPEPESSMTIPRFWCEVVIDNNGGISELHNNVAEFARRHLAIDL